MMDDDGKDDDGEDNDSKDDDGEDDDSKGNNKNNGIYCIISILIAVNYFTI
jgi:hypothetical protein